MQKLLIAITLILMAGCSGSSGGSNPTTPTPATNTAPVISDLVFTPSNVAIDSGGGARTITGTLRFTDLEGDVIKLLLLFAQGNAQSRRAFGYYTTNGGRR